MATYCSDSSFSIRIRFESGSCQGLVGGMDWASHYLYPCCHSHVYTLIKAPTPQSQPSHYKPNSYRSPMASNIDGQPPYTQLEFRKLSVKAHGECTRPNQVLGFWISFRDTIDACWVFTATWSVDIESRINITAFVQIPHVLTLKGPLKCWHGMVTVNVWPYFCELSFLVRSSNFMVVTPKWTLTHLQAHSQGVSDRGRKNSQKRTQGWWNSVDDVKKPILDPLHLFLFIPSER